MGFRAGIYLLVGMVFLLLVLPIMMLFVEAFFKESGKSFSEMLLLFEQLGTSSFGHSLALSTLVATLSTFFGTFFAIMVAKVRFAYWAPLVFLLFLGLLIPPYTLAFAWFEIFGREGFLGALLFGFWGVSGVLFSIYLPLSFLIIFLFLKQIPPAYEASARLMSGWWGVLYGVTLPLIAPAVLFSFLLVFILSFGEVSVANFLRYDLFALESFTYFSAFYDTRSATLLALPMVLLSGVFLFLIRGVLNQPFSLVSSATPRVMMEHRYVRYFALCVMILFVFVFLLFPLSSLFIKAFEAGVWSETIRDFWGSMLRSMLFASLVATFMMVLGFVGAIFIKERYRGAVWYENVLFFIFVLPLGVVGIAFILFWNHKVTNFIYQTPLIIILALVLKYLFLSTKTIQYHLSHIPKSMDESAQLLGASYAQRIGAIYLPMSKGVLMLSWLIGFIFSLRETSMTMLLTPAGMATLPVSTLTQMANGNPDTIATLLVIMIGMVLLAMLVVWGIWRKIR